MERKSLILTIAACLLIFAGIAVAQSYDLVQQATRFEKAVDFDGAVSLDGATTVSGVFSKDAANGGSVNIKVTSVTETTDSGAGTDTITACIPAGHYLLGVDCVVDTVIAGAGASTFSLGDGTDVDLYGTAIAFSAGTTIDESDYTASPATQAWSSSAGDLTMTADAGQFDSGQITCNCYTLDVTAGS